MTAVRILKKLFIGLLVLVGLFLVASVTLIMWLRAPVPEGGVSGPEADQLARQIEQAVNKPAWDKVGAIQWSMGERRRHLWDRTRGFDKVGLGDLEVLLDTHTKKGTATKAGKALEGQELEVALQRAYAAYINDTFWLNPLVKLFDEGVKREKVSIREDEGTTGLLITYTGGGITPGDQYLWIVAPDNIPRAWRMWTSIFPIQGIKVSWDAWTELHTGAKISTRHAMPGVEITLDGVRSADDVRQLTGGTDPFSGL